MKLVKIEGKIYGKEVNKKNQHRVPEARDNMLMKKTNPFPLIMPFYFSPPSINGGVFITVFENPRNDKPKNENKKMRSLPSQQRKELNR